MSQKEDKPPPDKDASDIEGHFSTQQILNSSSEQFDSEGPFRVINPKVPDGIQSSELDHPPEGSS